VAEIYITSKKLIETLKITDYELIEIETFFDSIPDDQWDLKEGTDYKVVAGNGLREYTCSGAFAIADYLQFKQQSERGWFRNLIDTLIRAIKGDIRKAFVKQQVLNNSSSLVQNNNRYFLSSADVVAIFKTRSDYLTKMFEEAKRDDKTALIKNEDYLELPDKGFYYSLSGMVKLGQVFSANIIRRNRKDWCSDVSEVVNPCMADILKQIDARNKAIDKAVNQARTRADKKCQVTDLKGTRVKPISMAGHHLYSRAEYPHLVDSVDNIICITVEVHNHFHQFMGGTQKPCTLDDFERYVKQYYPASNVFIWLQQQRLRLGNQQPIKTRDRHVLHLPWPIPQLLLPPASPNS
jgi:hypothetical protein